jgi:DNA mismatch repair protein MutS
LELAIFDSLCREVANEAPRLAAVAEALAVVDVASALAELACKRSYVRPRIDDSTILDIRQGRHPVVETMLQSGEFIANDCTLAVNDKRLWI